MFVCTSVCEIVTACLCVLLTSQVPALPGAPASSVPNILSRGSVVVRAINIGREPENLHRQPNVSVCVHMYQV